MHANRVYAYQIMARFKLLTCMPTRIRGKRSIFFPWCSSQGDRFNANSQRSSWSQRLRSSFAPAAVLPESLDVEHSTFQGLGIKSHLCRALKRDGITTPTLIQCEAIPAILHRMNYIVQSETGTGKTLTFLLPALQDPFLGLTTLILVPTRELAVQMHYQATTLAGTRKDSKRVCVLFSGTDEQATLQEYMDVNPHILIITPKRMLQLLETNSKDFINLRRLVLDEVDKILQPLSRHTPEKKRVSREIHPRPGRLVVQKLLSLSRRGRLQLICASATVNLVLQEELVELGWGVDVESISTFPAAKLASPTSIKHQYIFTSDEEGVNKLEALVEHFNSSGEKSALVFIHRGASIGKFVSELNEMGVKATALYTKALTPEGYPKFLNDFKSGRVQIVVSTEETVRGLDFTWLSTVYILEVPRNASEYLHLCGRVGRLGKVGRAVVFARGGQELKRLMMHYKNLQVEGRKEEI